MRAKNAEISNTEKTRLQQEADRFLVFARQLADRMADVGLDKLRGGLFDLVERQPRNNMPIQFAYSCTKDFWQQEQGILAYLILHGATANDQKYLALARECIGFWNLFFLGRDRQGIFFRTTTDGLPIIQGSYAQKGGHAISGYHAFELNYLAYLYTRLFVCTGSQSDNNFCLYFKVTHNGDKQTINVLPDFFPPDSIEIEKICFNGIDYTAERKPKAPNAYQICIEHIPPGKDGTLEIAVQFRQRAG